MNTSQTAMDATTRLEIVRKLSETLRACYVFPDVAEQICTRLQQHLEAGEYDDIFEGEFFAFALTTHMQEVNQDEHLWVRWHPEPLPDHQGPLYQSQEWLDKQRQRAQLDNYGLYRVERLPGNVGYIDIRYFHRPAWAGDTAAAAMNFLANTSALIIDLRQCLGGYPGMTVLVSSYLFEEPVHLGSIYWRDESVTQQYWTLPHVPGERFGRNPVYVLISRQTFSGGEGFARGLQVHQRATLVGEQTDGGAHPGACFRLHPHFEAFIPIGCVIDPITQQNWEDQGVIPGISVSSEQALNVAYGMALKSIVESVGESTSGPSSLLLQEAQAALENLD